MLAAWSGDHAGTVNGVWRVHQTEQGRTPNQARGNQTERGSDVKPNGGDAKQEHYMSNLMEEGHHIQSLDTKTDWSIPS